MKLLKTSKTLKNSKKKLLIVAAITILFIICVDILLFLFVVKKDKDSRSVIDTSYSTNDTTSLDSTSSLSRILELKDDTNSITIISQSDTCKVTSKLSVEIKSLKLESDINYKFYPYPKEEEVIRLTRLLNYTMGKHLQNNGTNELSKFTFQKDFNNFINSRISMAPYFFNGKVYIEIKSFNLGKM